MSISRGAAAASEARELHARSALYACADREAPGDADRLAGLRARYCFRVTPGQRWEQIARHGNWILARRAPPIAGEPPLYFRAAALSAATEHARNRAVADNLLWITPLLALAWMAQRLGLADSWRGNLPRTMARSDPKHFDPRMKPVDYEGFCALLLRRAGWDAQAIGMSGDQGTDVLARHGRRALVVQCKLYGRPVGNSAVQQIAAARAHHGAELAAVVSNAGFTRSARELARSNKVLLLHHDELRAFSPASVSERFRRDRRA